MKKKVFNFAIVLITLICLAAIIMMVFSVRPVALSHEYMDIPTSEIEEVEWHYEEEGNN